MAEHRAALPGRSDPDRRPIAILPAGIVDRIAAGEVVERPASVVKELVENALDAGATEITVEVEAGGKRLVRVIDNGIGMTGGDAALALRRHATSKLRAVEELFALDTMGFRGEALPSIAAVSRLELVTRTRGEVAGTRLRVEGGEVVDTAEVGAPVGTRIEVRDLLYNVPARLKFLKGDATEASHVTEVVSRLAMAHPAVHFRLVHGSRTALDAPAHRDGLERARTLVGARTAGRLAEARGEEHGVRVVAYLAPPDLAQTTARGLQLFVGRRHVRDRGLLHAVAMGYGELVPRGRYPVAVVFVDAPQGEVDINVHPQKLEVRFSDPQRVYAAVRHTVSRQVASAPWLDAPAPGTSPVKMRALASAGPPPARGGAGAAPGGASELAAGYARERARTLFSWDRARSPRPEAPPLEPRRLAEVSFPVAPSVTAGGTAAERGAGAAADWGAGAAAERGAGAAADRSAAGRADAEKPENRPQRPSAATGFFQQLRYLGQLDRTYLLCERDGELVLIDQHAAHERVEYQRLKERYSERRVAVQRLLFPHTLELPERERALVSELTGELSAVGFELEPFGGDTVAIKAVPAGVSGGDVAGVVRELVGELADEGGSRALEEKLDLVFATIACHSVVRAGDALSAREVEALFRSLDAVDFRAHCPHGRPVLLRISVGEIARRFGRS